MKSYYDMIKPIVFSIVTSKSNKAGLVGGYIDENILWFTNT